MQNTIYRFIPQIDEILRDENLIFSCAEVPHDLVTDCVRDTVDVIRTQLHDDSFPAAAEIRSKDDMKQYVIGRTLKKLQAKSRPALVSLINATGVVLHTNLGRAVLSERACAAVQEAAAGYTDLEFDVEKNCRGSRHDHIESLIRKITGAEAAMVVNNNAAATVICLAALASGREVITSRGELIEIGGSFRIPDIMELSGAKLKEVGTTNKTRLSDYEKAYAEGVTGALLKVHTSNYKIIGFTEEAQLKDLVPLGHRLGLPVIYDMGSGLFADLSRFGVEEPTVPRMLATGADVIMCSGDKLLGGPQAGILIGKKVYIDQMKSHPLARAFRVDKMTIAALAATLYEYYDEDNACRKVPVIRMLAQTSDDLLAKARRLEALLKEAMPGLETEVIPSRNQVGGGSAPGTLLPGYAVAVSRPGMPAEKLERLLRKADRPVISRIAHDKVCLEVRTLLDGEPEQLAEIFRRIGGQLCAM